MRVKVGEKVTASVDIHVQYRCSKCGHDNSSTATIRASAYTRTIFGINLDPYVSDNAQRALKSTLETLTDQKYPERFRTADLFCKCSNCKHREPWTRMRNTLFDKCRSVCVFFAILSGIVLLLLLKVMTLDVMSLTLIALFAVSIAGVIGIPIWKERHAEKMEKLIADLPQESLPTISLFPSYRY